MADRVMTGLFFLAVAATVGLLLLLLGFAVGVAAGVVPVPPNPPMPPGCHSVWISVLHGGYFMRVCP